MLKLQFPVMRRFSRSAFQLLQKSRPSSASATIPKTEINEKPSVVPPIKELQEDVAKNTKTPIDTGLVAAAFSMLKAEDHEIDEIKKAKSTRPSIGATIENEIDSVDNLDNLLELAKTYQLSKRHALKVLSKLSEWSSGGKVQINDFKSDVRFISICRSLGKSTPITGYQGIQHSEDLSTILSITGDEEAAKLVSNLNVPQMIKVISALALKKRRSTPILRSIAYNISKSPEVLNIKHIADLLYAMASLNFPDEVLLQKICNDIQETLPQNKDKSSVVASIVTSLGILKYKEPQLLEALTQWFISHADIARSQDVAALVITLAMLNYCPSGVDELPKVSEFDVLRPSMWLDYVWSLCVIEKVTEEQLATALSSKFIDSLKIGDEIPIPCKKKLININSYAALMIQKYKGPFVDEDISDLPVKYSKEKLTFVTSVMETLKSLLSSDQYIKKNCNSNMGFLYDAECVLDSKFQPHPVNTPPKKGKSLTKIAILALDYHDICKQTPDPLGSIMLYKRLLEKKDYKVLFIPYNEFDIKDKLVTRVQYIEKKLKEMVKKA